MNDLKISLTTSLDDKITFKDFIELLHFYKYEEIELLTLEMEKFGRKNRLIKDGSEEYGWNYEEKYKIFGPNTKTVIRYKQDDYYNISPSIYFSNTISPIIGDKFKSYSRSQIVIQREKLYKFILDVKESPNYKLISKKITGDGVVSIFKYNEPVNYSFLIITYDGSISVVSFLISK